MLIYPYTNQRQRNTKTEASSLHSMMSTAAKSIKCANSMDCCDEREKVQVKMKELKAKVDKLEEITKLINNFIDPRIDREGARAKLEEFSKDHTDFVSRFNSLMLNESTNQITYDEILVKVHQLDSKIQLLWDNLVKKNMLANITI